MIQEKSDLYRNVENFVGACCYYSGLVAFARLWQRHAQKSLIILNYHHAVGGDLRKHMLYLRKHYRLLHLEEALEELYASRQDQPENKKPALVLTFDDGYRDNYTHAAPLAEELQVPITIFLVPGYIESGQPFWWFEGEGLVSQTRVRRVTLDEHTYQLDNANDRAALTKVINERVWCAATVREREEFLVRVHDLLGVSTVIADKKSGDLPANWEEIRAMADRGWVSFGAHTMHHPVLAYMSDLAQVRHEVGECRTVLEQQLDLRVRTFAYPIGQLEHIGAASYAAVRQLGYSWALTTESGFNTPRTDPYLLYRICIDVRDDWRITATRVAGIEKFCSRLFWTSINFVRALLKMCRLSSQ